LAQTKCVPSAIREPVTGASPKPSTNPAGVAYARFIADLEGHSPRPIPPFPHVLDLQDRADHLDKVLTALSVYLTAILDDTAHNVPGGLDRRQIDALLSRISRPK
jgi:hypothetical protein